MQALYHVARHEKLMQLTKTLLLVAYAHSVFATFCELNSPAIACARYSSCPIIRSPGFVPIVANAHSVFATSCG